MAVDNLDHHDTSGDNVTLSDRLRQVGRREPQLAAATGAGLPELPAELDRRAISQDIPKPF